MSFTPRIREEVRSRYPDYQALSIVVRDFAQERPFPALNLPVPHWRGAHIDAWKAVFKTFGANPKRTPPSVESLLKMPQLPTIHPVVDFYNALSIAFGAPFGGEDIAKYDGSPQLVIADGTEEFDTVKSGEPVIEHPERGEIIWRDDKGVTCRRWNWRQCKRTAIREGSQDLWFVIDRLPPMAIEDLQRAGETLIAGLKQASPSSITTVELL